MAVGDVFIDPRTGQEYTVVFDGGSLEAFSARVVPYERQSRGWVLTAHGFHKADPDLSSYRPKSRVRI